MTEQEWLECDDPLPMLTFLCGPLDRVASDFANRRKYLLLACACFDRLGELVPPLARAWPKYAMLAAEGRYYDERALAAAGVDADYSLLEAMTCANEEGSARIEALMNLWIWHPDAVERGVHYKAERWEQARILRDIIGNPFHSEHIAPTIISETVARLAQSIYDDRAFDRLPILADALEEAGCADAEILGHCRGPGPHVRGCWVVDLLLGKE
jgi:hypothetical protein